MVYGHYLSAVSTNHVTVFFIFCHFGDLSTRTYVLILRWKFELTNNTKCRIFFSPYVENLLQQKFSLLWFIQLENILREFRSRKVFPFPLEIAIHRPRVITLTAIFKGGIIQHVG